MTTSIALGRAASCLSQFASGLCLTLVASAFLFAADAQAQTQTQTQAAPAAVAEPAPRAPGQGPALWVIRDADSTVYLFGAVHLLRPGAAWGSDKVDAAFDSASDVWFEVVNPDDQTAMMTAIRDHGLSPERPLSSRLTGTEKARLDAAVRAMGMDPAQIDPMRPWFAAMLVGVTPLTTAGYDPSAGVELNLRARATAAGKTLHGFETLDQQLAGLAGMTDEGETTYLRHYLAHSDEAVSEMDRLVAGWAVGDLEAVSAYARANGRDISDETHEIFMARRNADWAGQIETLMAGSGTAFIAVGAAHLVGEDSVQALLADKGIHAVLQ
ncbi:MAG: TraB/GumN family protein [Brevundimonas sp.]|nr:MAG: TraB/GumN family protein [Brevundimonas sp.]